MAMVWRVVVTAVLAGMVGAARAGAPDAAGAAGIAAENPAYVQASAATRAKLAKTIRFAVKEQKFEDAVAAFGREIGAEVAINWGVLKAAGVERNATVTLDVPEAMPAEVVLELLLSEVGGPEARLGFGIDKGVLMVSTREELQSERYRVMRVYDVAT